MALLLGGLLLSGCTEVFRESAALGAGVSGAALASAVTKDPAVTTGIGLGVDALATAGVKSVEKRVHRQEQDEIAAKAGPLSVGAVASWAVPNRVIANREGGEVTVTRLIQAGGLDCKEVIFSVEQHGKNGEAKRAYYTTNICRDGEMWRWAGAEPATERWGALQ